MINPQLVSGFLRTLGLVAPLVGQPGVTAIVNAAASLLDAGYDGYVKFNALTEQMKARAEAGVETTAEEILSDVDRIQKLNQQIQDA